MAKKTKKLMSAELKERLRLHAAKKKEHTCLAKHMTEVDWMVACDWVKENHHADSDDVALDSHLVDAGYLRRLPASVVASVASQLPHRYARIRAHPAMGGHRELVLFREETLCELLRFLGLLSKGRRGWKHYVHFMDYYGYLGRGLIRKESDGLDGLNLRSSRD